MTGSVTMIAISASNRFTTRRGHCAARSLLARLSALPQSRYRGLTSDGSKAVVTAGSDGLLLRTPDMAIPIIGPKDLSMRGSVRQKRNHRHHPPLLVVPRQGKSTLTPPRKLPCDPTHALD